jgi:hypothetical protein
MGYGDINNLSCGMRYATAPGALVTSAVHLSTALNARHAYTEYRQPLLY